MAMGPLYVVFNKIKVGLGSATIRTINFKILSKIYYMGEERSKMVIFDVKKYSKKFWRVLNYVFQIFKF